MSEDIRKHIEAQLVALYGQYRNDFIRTIGRQYKLDELEAEEIFSCCIAILCEKMHDDKLPDLEKGMEEYCYGIGRLLAPKYVADRRKYTADPSLLLTEYLAATSGVEEKEQFELEVQLAHKALRRLGTRCRILLGLFYVQQLTYETICRLMDYTDKGSASTQKYKCLEKWRAKFYQLRSHLLKVSG
ncbi:MAG: hypothetical protein R3301_11235 [Saprospiraceae bacterium]|nr:hypothetical protein [Saprospiraceae bacterium]